MSSISRENCFLSDQAFSFSHFKSHIWTFENLMRYGAEAFFAVNPFYRNCIQNTWEMFTVLFYSALVKNPIDSLKCKYNMDNEDDREFRKPQRAPRNRENVFGAIPGNHSLIIVCRCAKGGRIYTYSYFYGLFWKVHKVTIIGSFFGFSWSNRNHEIETPTN